MHCSLLSHIVKITMTKARVSSATYYSRLSKNSHLQLVSWVATTCTKISRLVANTSPPVKTHYNSNPDTIWTNLVYVLTKLPDRIWAYPSPSQVSTECSFPWDKVVLYCRIQESFQVYLQIREVFIAQSLITYTVTFTLALPTILHVNEFILVINQIDAKNLFYNKFISSLYMFRAPCAHHKEVNIVLYSLWYRHTYKCDGTRGCII